jgi:demethylmenaquinone methyltransferase/2-methoxy-6-polyprenyl-1,4-benzoquinol methylase
VTDIKITDRIQYFNGLGSRWDETVGNDDARRARIAEIFGRLASKHGDRVLDAGTGNGVLLPFIEERIGAEGSVLALDPAGAMLERAKALYSRFSNIDYLVSSLRGRIARAHSTHPVFCRRPHLLRHGKAFRNLRGAIRDDGALYIFHLTTPHR